jgi:hypothetical protein
MVLSLVMGGGLLDCGDRLWTEVRPLSDVLLHWLGMDTLSESRLDEQLILALERLLVGIQ